MRAGWQTSLEITRSEMCRGRDPFNGHSQRSIGALFTRVHRTSLRVIIPTTHSDASSIDIAPTRSSKKTRALCRISVSGLAVSTVVFRRSHMILAEPELGTVVMPDAARSRSRSDRIPTSFLSSEVTGTCQNRWSRIKSGHQPGSFPGRAS